MPLEQMALSLVPGMEQDGYGTGIQKSPDIHPKVDFPTSAAERKDQSSRRIMPEMAAAAMAVTTQPATMNIFWA